MASNPLEQFEIKTILPIKFGMLDISITNSSIFMFLALIIISIFWFLATAPSKLIPNRLQMVSELIYDMIDSMIDNSVGAKGKKFFPIIFSLFMIILFTNAIGLIPYAFTSTSHIAVTFTLAAFVIVTVIITGFVMHGFHFLSLFAPSGVPLIMQFFMVPIEIVSFFARSVSLSLRLGANMVAGHIMTKVFAGFIPLLIFAGSDINYLTAPVSILPFAINVILQGFELFVACLQAYIFSMLACIYLNDAINLH